MQNIPRADSMSLNQLCCLGSLADSEFPGTLGFTVLSDTALQWPGRTKLLRLRKQQVSEKPVDKNSGILVPRSDAKV